MPDTTNNMALWSAVEKTDPAHTKHVAQRGGFTSIDAEYQVMRATEVFGPVGVGWGYDVEYLDLHISNQVLIGAQVTVWHGNRENRFGPVMGCNALVNDKGRTDEDAPKKAMTDGLTKALSHLGFSADVFLGRYDDNKYVATVKAESEAAKLEKTGAVPEEVKAMLDAFRGSDDTPRDWWKRNKAEIDALPVTAKNWLQVKMQEPKKAT